MELSSEFASNAEVITALFTRMGDFEERLRKATTSPQPAEVHTDLPALAQDFVDFKVLVWQALSKLKSQTDLLALGLDRHETFLRRKVLLFHGVAETKDEKTDEVVLKILSEKMKLPDLTLEELQTCHRIGSITTKPRSILVRFCDLRHRRLVWDTKTALRDSGIIISEFLTKTRHEVFMTARKHFGVRNCWSSDGKITILLPDKSRRKIETSGELRSLTASFPAVAASPKPEQSKVKRNAVQPALKPTGNSSAGASRKLRGRPT